MLILNLFQNQHDGFILRVGMEKKVTPFAGQSSFAKEISTLVQTLSKNNASVMLGQVNVLSLSISIIQPQVILVIFLR